MTLILGLGKLFLLFAYDAIHKFSKFPLYNSQEMYIILNTWPIILMFTGSKVGIKGIASTNPQQYYHERYLRWLICQLQTIFNMSVHVTACNLYI